MATALDIIKDALADMGALDAGETPEAEDAQLALRILNRLLDQWNAQNRFIYTVTFSSQSWTANQSSRTIGPTGNFVVTKRPDSIQSARWVDSSSTPTIYEQIEIRDKDWFASRALRNYGTTVPYDLYYDPSWPNGTIYLIPYPTVTRNIELEIKTLLAALTLTSTFTLPQGYEEAVEKTLAERLCLPFGKTIPDQLVVEARRARGIIKSNKQPPRIYTDELNSSGSGFDYRTREIL